ncbi:MULTISPECIES: DUF6302 family protein [unclassified Streptomyces]|nr:MULTISPECIES: DUF6302 family protein [unclassified Streptomyces]MYZ35586.1 hypothetical protein [Streptomyces sp. SID4917]
MLERLADPALMDAAGAVPVGETDCGVQYGLAVPTGGYRLGGYLTVTNHAAALAAMSTMEGRPGFPSVRVRRAVTAPWASRTVLWGADPPQGDIGVQRRHLGYSDEAIARYEERALAALAE